MANLKLNADVVNTVSVAYAKEEAQELWIDCADGCNPYGCSEKVLEVLENVPTVKITDYPHNFDMKDAIIDYWKDHAELTRGMLTLTNGAMEAIGLITTLFACEGATALGVWPQFTDFVFNAKCHGIGYKAVDLLPESNYKIDADRIIEAMTDEVNLMYFDNPNNPTGQNYPPEVMRRILEAAKEKGIAVIFDEAYGDYLEPEDSAFNFINEFENLIIVKTNSKGLGLAGMRTGYIAASEYISEQFTKITCPYNISGLGRAMTAAALEDREFIKANRTKAAAYKNELKKHLAGKLSMAENLDSCTICMLVHENPEVDLAELFASYGVSVVAGSDFEGLGANKVRLRVPKPDSESALLEVIDAINLSA